MYCLQKILLVRPTAPLQNKTSLAKIKIIDFANATMPGVFEYDSIHEGPDGGFLLGLENLQEILESLVEDEPQARKP